MMIAAPLPAVTPFASTSLDKRLVVPAARFNNGSVPPPLITVGTSARPIIATLFVMAGNCNPSVMGFVTPNSITLLPGVALA